MIFAAFSMKYNGDHNRLVLQCITGLRALVVGCGDTSFVSLTLITDGGGVYLTTSLHFSGRPSLSFLHSQVVSSICVPQLSSGQCCPYAVLCVISADHVPHVCSVGL